MAKIDSKGHLKGTVGPVTYRAFNGNTYVQSKPGKGRVKQTAATKKSASDFGRASSLAKALRTTLYPILQNHSDGAFYRRFATQVNTATQAGNPQPKGSRFLTEGDLSLLVNLECNMASPFARYCTVVPELSLSETRQLIVRLPEFSVLEQVAAVSQATDATLMFLITTVNPETLVQTQAELFPLEFSLTDQFIPAQQWTTAAQPEGQLITVAAALFYYRNNHLAGKVLLNGKGFHPCEVSAVLKG